MVSYDPKLRPSIDDVKCHPFMLGRYPHRHEVYEEFRHRKVVVVGAKRLRELEKKIEKEQKAGAEL